ncbi:50S ribosomal protein L32 [bacterium]|nr:50S ribosomal protein L32 [bacterium]
MAVPKKRTGASAQAKRRANWKAIKPTTTTCKNCGATVLTHTVCTECGYYKGKAVSIKSPDYVESAVEEKKTAKKSSTKKSTSKKAKKEEVVIEETTAAETDVKAEETVEESSASETEEKTEE